MPSNVSIIALARGVLSQNEMELAMPNHLHESSSTVTLPIYVYALITLLYALPFGLIIWLLT